MRRTVAELLDPTPRNVTAVWDFFNDCCAYCGTPLSRDGRAAHIDHAVPGAGNQLGNLVLACGTCNGDEKREESWREFLTRKTNAPDVLVEREARIEGWLARNPLAPSPTSPEIELRRTELEQLIDQFGVKCAELKKLVGAARASTDAS
jgi:hypothetical protein